MRKIVLPMFVFVVSCSCLSAGGAVKGGMFKLLNDFPSKPDTHIKKLKELPDNTWVKLEQTKPDAEWGIARGRSWASSMTYIPRLRGAVLHGEGVHGWYNKKTNRYGDDFWFYDINQNKWFCMYPGYDITNPPDISVNDEGIEVTKSGEALPIATHGHSRENSDYDPATDTYMMIRNPGVFWKAVIGESRNKWLDKVEVASDWSSFVNVWYLSKTNKTYKGVSPWIYSVKDNFWTRHATKSPGISAKYSVMRFIPELKKILVFGGGTEMRYYNLETKDWEKLTVKGEKPPSAGDKHFVLDPKRKVVYMAGGNYTAKNVPESTLWVFDYKINTWTNLKPKGEPCGGDQGYGVNTSKLVYDEANDVLLLISWKKKPADAAGVYVYDLNKNEWTTATTEMPAAQYKNCGNSFYDPELNVHFLHISGDSNDTGEMHVYRYKKK